jgi:ethanolamine utilization protein EutL
MTGDRLKASVLAVNIIPAVDAALTQSLQLPPHIKSVGLITCDSDDVGYTALDETTKQADVEVMYARSMYAGAANANTALVGEFLGILGSGSVESVQSGVKAATHFIENEASFISANTEDTVSYYAHCVSACGSYLAKAANVPAGTAIAYLIAPPLEAVSGIDAALKEADVSVGVLYTPPTETNFGGGLLTGTQASCRAACAAFAREVCRIAGGQAPVAYIKREHETNLNKHTLVSKVHPSIALRGKLDTLVALITDIQYKAIEDGCPALVSELEDVCSAVKEVMAADVLGTSITRHQIISISFDELREASHTPQRFGFSGHVMPSPRLGRLFLALNYLRTQIRETELAAVNAYEKDTSAKETSLLLLNRLSSAVYVLSLKYAARL